MAIRNGYFYSGGRRYIPLGRFGCYFDAGYAGEDSGYLSQHGDSLIEFQRCTPSVWRKFFRYISEKDGCTAIRMSRAATAAVRRGRGSTSEAG